MTHEPTPGERRLSHPPSDRYRLADAYPSPGQDPAASRVRGIAFAGIAGLVGAAAITVSAGLLVAAAATAWAVATGLRVGANGRITRGDRIRLALTLALAAIALGQAGLWLYARWEGGVLAPLDYLWEVFGFLVPLEFGVAALVAWLAAR